MNEYFNFLKKVSLFRGIEEKDMTVMLSCLGARVIHKEKEEFILNAGDKPEYIGIVLAGGVQIIKEDAQGRRAAVAALAPGELFAEALCCAGVEESPVSVMACADSAIMLLAFKKILHICPNSCLFHTKLIENMLYVVAQKNLMLQNRLDFIGKKSLREKILNYLESFTTAQGRNNITIPFNREELANFLCVERSSLSHELARMKQEGILDYYKNHFRLL